MSYKIILDSCGELPVKYKEDKRFAHVPLELEVDGYRIIDDDTFNQADFIKRVAESKSCPKSSCPSPELYREACNTPEENIYIVTLSSKQSGSYNSACLGRDLYIEKYGKKNIYVIDSESASGGETQIALLAMELNEQGLAFEEICIELDQYRDSMKTYFVLDNLETLRKNGRLTGVKALVASTLNIKPVMGTDGKGSIVQLTQTIGIKKALKKMSELAVKECLEPLKRRVIITHANAIERAESVKKLLLELKQFKEIIIMDMAGISTMYANDGGIIVTV